VRARSQIRYATEVNEMVRSFFTTGKAVP